MKKTIIFISLLLLISIFAVGCGEATSENSDPSTEAEDSNVDYQEGENEEDDDTTTEESGLSLGETVEMGNLSFTARSARWDNGSEFLEPDEGTKWLVIDAEITNNSDESTTISSILMFSLYDDENYAAEHAIFAETRGSLDGELGAGRSMAGEIAFEVSDTSHSFEFIFEPEVFGFGQSIYNIDISQI